MASPHLERAGAILWPDSSKVVGRPHIPGDDPAPVGVPRLTAITSRILGLSDADVATELVDVRQRFGARHADLDTMLVRNAERVAHLLDGVDDDRRALVGAYLTQEHAYQSAAVTNPSMVAAPSQAEASPGAKRFVLSLRTVGEGHISSIAFSTGEVSASGEVILDERSRFTETGERGVAVYERKHFSAKLEELGADVSLTDQVLDTLGRHFGRDELERAIGVLDGLPRAVTHESTKLMRWLAASNYLLDFDAARTTVQERLIWPEGPFESKGMEDARFVQLTEDDGSTTYYGTYTAYDGFEILPQLIETRDFCAFEMSTLSGASAQNKGMALFPRLVDGCYLALSRPDRENLHLLRSPDPRGWYQGSTPLRRPQRAWELIQMGNCGSPIETEAGWLVLTHGVGPMRTYRIGALLLDLEDPERIIGDLPEPLLEAREDEREGYVPNVVYSCGGMVHGDHLVLPYGIADQRTGFARCSLGELLEALLAAPPDRAGVGQRQTSS